MRDTFAPRLSFAYEDAGIWLLPPDQETGDPLYPASPQVFELVVSEPNTLPILGLDLRVSTVRQIAVDASSLRLASEPIEVGSIDDLIKIADAAGGVALTAEMPDEVSYWVIGERAAYVYSVPLPKARSS